MTVDLAVKVVVVFLEDDAAMRVVDLGVAVA